MSDCGPATSVIDWVIEHPESLPLFQELGVDYSYGGKLLEFACSECGLDLQLVLSSLQRTIRCNCDHDADLQSTL